MSRCPHVLRARWLRARRVECLDCHLDRRARWLRRRERMGRVLVWAAIPFAALVSGAIVRVLISAARRLFT